MCIRIIAIIPIILLVLLSPLLIADYDPTDRYRPLRGGILVETGYWEYYCEPMIGCWWEINGLSDSTLGYTAYKNIGGEDIYGFVIAGHAVDYESGWYIYQPNYDGPTVNYVPVTGENYIGGIDYDISQEADAVFEDTSSENVTPYILRPVGFAPVNDYMEYSEVIPGVTYVYKMGVATSETCGIVTRKELWYNVSGHTYEYVIFANYTGYFGDSGGPVYIIVGSGVTLVGHVLGGYTVYGEAYFISVTSDESHLGIYPYCSSSIPSPPEGPTPEDNSKYFGR